MQGGNSDLVGTRSWLQMAPEGPNAPVQRVFVESGAMLLVFGANRVPDIARTLAKGIQQVKTASRDFREEIEKSAEAQGLDTKELQKEVNDIKKEFNNITGTVKRKR